MNNPLLPLADAQEMLMSSAQKLPTESINIAQALGRTTSEDIISLRNQPAGNMSAMDGYAVKYDASATSWNIAGECRAGYPPCDEITHGQAARIFTGALLPKGVDTVIIQENMDASGDTVKLRSTAAIKQGQNIRRKGNDFTKDDTILKAGTILTPAMIGLLIAAGHAQINVHKKPKIAIISTGDELRPAGEPCEDHQIAASNGPMITALLDGCDIVFNNIVPDDIHAITTCINDHRSCDIIVTIGGASVGDHDLILPALKALDAEIDFMKAAIKPGKPIMTAHLDNMHIIGLPGNPASAYVTAILFLLPLVKYMSGVEDYLPDEQTAQTSQELPKTGPRVEFLRARVEDGKITPFSTQDSGKLSTLSRANSLLIRDSNAEHINAGEWVEYIPISNI